MSVVRPFRGLRPRPEHAARVASPPYDVVSLEEARAQAAGNPWSLLRITRAELELPDATDPHAPEVYARARVNLDRFRSEGVLMRDPRPCLYLYRLTRGGRTQTGLVALSPVDEYERGLIRKHERTRPVKVQDRVDHIIALDAQVGPVFSTFRARAGISELFVRLTAGPPAVDFVAADGVRHALWVVDRTGDLQAMIAAFSELDALYIADGHHRGEAAALVARRRRDAGDGPDATSQFFLNVIFPHDELTILPYNRVVGDLGTLTVEEILARSQAAFRSEPWPEPVRPAEPHVFGLYAGGPWHRLVAAEGSFDPADPVGSIASAVLDRNLLAPILGITDPRTDPRIDFVGGSRGVEELERLVDGGRFRLAFSLPATTIEQLLGVADAGSVMPPKSTWFEPKLRSGMVVNLLTE